MGGASLPAPFATAAIAAHVVAMRPDSELFAWWLADLCPKIKELGGASLPAPFATAAIAAHVVAMRPDSELFAWWLADLVLAQSLRWPRGRCRS